MSKNREKTKKSKWKTVLIVLLVLILLAGMVYAGAYMFLLNKFNKLNFSALPQDEVSAEKPVDSGSADSANSSDNSDGSDSSDSSDSADSSADAADMEYRSDKDVINILLVGVDNNYLPGMEQRGNSDGIVIASLNKNSGKIILTSIMRDTSISIPGGGSDKATMVYHNHGLSTLIDAIQYTFDIKIDNYVLVNYLNVINIIDAAGGVDAEIKSENISEMQMKMKNINYLVGDPEDSDVLGYEDVGTVRLNGKQAAAFMRLRLTSENDFGRTARIRHVLSELKNRVKEMSLSELNEFANVAMENITTDLSAKDMMSIIASAPKYMKYGLETLRIPMDNAYSSNSTYLHPDLDVTIPALHEAIYGN